MVVTSLGENNYFYICIPDPPLLLYLFFTYTHHSLSFCPSPLSKFHFSVLSSFLFSFIHTSPLHQKSLTKYRSKHAVEGENNEKYQSCKFTSSLTSSVSTSPQTYIHTRVFVTMI
jgi:hypothetical protein